MAQQSGHKRDNMVVLSDDEEASTDSNSAQPSKKRRKLNDGQAHGLTKSTKKQSNNLTQRSIFSSFGLKDPNPPKQQKQSKKHDKKAMRFKANTNTNDTQTVQSVCDSDHPLIPFNPKERKNDVLSHTIDGIAVYKCQKRHTKRQWTNAKYIKTGNEIQYIQSNCFYFTEDKYNSIKKNAGLKGNIYEFMKFEDKMDTSQEYSDSMGSREQKCWKNITFHDDTKKWNDNSITPHLRSAKDQQKNVFLKIDDKIPIRRYSKKTTMKAISFKRRFIESQVKNIQNRLKHVKQFNKYKVFSVEVMNEFIKGNVMPKDCTKKRDILRWLKENEYMKDETQDIIQDCGVNSIDSIDVVEELQTIWYSMIRFLRRQQGSRAKQTTTRLFWTLNNRELYPRMKYLRKHCQKSLLIPFNSACCERGFSKQNWILGNRRLSMSTDLLRNLMFIIMNGEKWENDERLLEVLSKSIKKFVRSNRTLTSNI
eukprot:198753_1